MPPRRENTLAREIVAALAESNLLNPTLRANTNDRAMEAMREFCRLKPPQFDGESSDPLVADHWLSQICKIFNALKITEDDLRVSIVACQLIGEANEWWESVLGVRRDARRAARAVNQGNEPDEENLTWAEFEELFKNQYFPKTCREKLRGQFEKLEQGNMTVSDYAIKFQSLSRFAPESVTTEERKCRRFEKGLHSSVRLLVVSQRIGKFSEIVECARSIENPVGALGNVEVWKPRQPTVSVSTPSGSFGSQGRKRQREPNQPSQNQSNLRLPTSSGNQGVPLLNRSCYTCGEPGHIARNCPQESGVRGESGSMQQHKSTPKQQQTQFYEATSGRGSRVGQRAYMINATNSPPPTTF